MIAGIFHEGSGLGDQLFRYITTRTLAEDKGYAWGMWGSQHFKGKDFLKGNLYASQPFSAEILDGHQLFCEEDVRDVKGNDIRSYDPEINFVKDNTVIDGCFEDDKYWRHKLPKIDKWLSVEPIHIPDNVCVIGFRGGEYATVPELFLTQDYWKDAIEEMMKIGADGLDIASFEIHTDDPDLAQSFFSEMRFGREQFKLKFKVIHDIGINWRSVRYAKHAIIANSAFYIIPRLLRHQDSNAITMAPRYWARRNIKTWARPACYYKEFSYV